jgi:hypothetical protein
MSRTRETAPRPRKTAAPATAAAETTDGHGAPEPPAARPAPQAARESLQWWTPAAMAWGTPVKMWATIVASVWRPFLPPTALTHGQRPTETPGLPPDTEPAPPPPVPGTTRRQR